MFLKLLIIPLAPPPPPLAEVILPLMTPNAF